MNGPVEESPSTNRPRITEAAFQRQVLQLARMLGWRVAHFRTSLNQRGKWQTAVAGDGAGFPDLVLVRAHELLFVELKQDKRYPQPAQREWHAALRAAGADVRIWKPADWPEIERTLTARRIP